VFSMELRILELSVHMWCDPLGPCWNRQRICGTHHGFDSLVHIFAHLDFRMGIQELREDEIYGDRWQVDR